jgi:hypothetical protein
MTKRLLYRIIWVPSAVACLLTFFIFANRPVAEAEPGDLTPYTMSDKSLQMQRPANWKATELGSAGVESGVRFEGGPLTSIRISTDLTGSLMADIAKAGGGAVPSLPGMEGLSAALPTGSQKSPLEKLHEEKGTKLAQDPGFDSYTEGKTRQEKIAGADALVTDFTYQEQGLFGNEPMVGERATALLGDRRLLVMARCPKKSGSKLLPLFEKIMDSVQPGQGGS